MPQPIEFGSKVRCIATGFEGIVVARCEYISGTVEYGLRSVANTDASRPPVEWLEECLVEVLEGGVRVKPVKHFGFKVES